MVPFINVQAPEPEAAVNEKVMVCLVPSSWPAVKVPVGLTVPSSTERTPLLVGETPEASEIFTLQVLALTWPLMTIVPSAVWAWADIKAIANELTRLNFCIVECLIMKGLLEVKIEGIENLNFVVKIFHKRILEDAFKNFKH